MEINIHTIFVLRENILFMDEWVSYHLSRGVHKFYLYDNSKSVGRCGSTSEINKYNFNFKHITKKITDSELQKHLNSFLNKYKNCVHYIVWEPIDDLGNIVYYQKESILHYINNYSKYEGWTIYLDMDEFIYNTINLKHLLLECEENNIGHITLLQKKFDDRYNNINLPVTRITNCIEGIDTRNWGTKCFVKNKNFDYNADYYWNIHCLPATKCGRLIADSETLRFNHYNVNDVQLKWMKEFYSNANDFQLNAICRSISDIFQYDCSNLIRL